MIKRPTPAYWRLLGYLRPYGFPYIALAILATLMLSATNGVIPFAARRIFEQMASIKDLSAVKLLSMEILGLFLLRALANFVGAYLGAWVEQKVALDLRADLNN